MGFSLVRRVSAGSGEGALGWAGVPREGGGGARGLLDHRLDDEFPRCCVRRNAQPLRIPARRAMTRRSLGNRRVGAFAQRVPVLCESCTRPGDPGAGRRGPRTGTSAGKRSAGPWK
ncbi:hypothetical protein SCOCK_10196 [Actinacidiphila cocklensis]|uniref:Uncharacterized protein n=1 Tax=Actinacidiphila cocklensis TaxID=887465 RepID=A0A9W4DIN1_9ACTN|nr:hypothetical protein SCOCK_10196 [Actinacidiphila cocklensis]